MRYFDAYIMVDWSAKGSRSPANPAKDAVWVGEKTVDDVGNDVGTTETFFRTRANCFDHIERLLKSHVGKGERLLIGFDFAYGYPAGFAVAAGMTGPAPPWRRVWSELSEHIEDYPDNSSNRFSVASALNRRCNPNEPGPFWGVTAKEESDWLLRTAPSYPFQTLSGIALGRYRLSETRLGGASPVWKLMYPGSVGSQTLLGIPVVSALRDDPSFGNVSRVWPFETGFNLPQMPRGKPFILHAEIWPRVVEHLLDPAIPIRDQAQVRAMVNWLAKLDTSKELQPLFERPAGIPDASLATCINEEGWILGAR